MVCATTNRATIPGLDGIRALAACLVVWWHASGITPVDMRMEPRYWMVHGVVSVQAFFTLSGYLITSLLLRESEKTGAVSLPLFYIRRALRIFPAYYLMLAGAAALSASGVVHIGGLRYAAAYLYNFIPRGQADGLLVHTWSLAVEEHFYLVWPALFVALRRRRRTLVAVAFALVLLGVVGAWLVTRDPAIVRAYNVDRWTYPAGAPIMFGCLLALLTYGESGSQWRSVLSNRGTVAVGLALWASPVVVNIHNFLFRMQVIGAGVALLVVWIALNPRALATRVLDWALLAHLGKMSYGIYLWHGLIMSSTTVRAPGQAWPLQQRWSLALTFLVVPISYYLVESPILRLKDRFRTPSGTRRESSSAAGQHSQQYCP